MPEIKIRQARDTAELLVDGEWVGYIRKTPGTWLLIMPNRNVTRHATRSRAVEAAQALLTQPEGNTP
jgi:hypothetical protein